MPKLLSGYNRSVIITLSRKRNHHLAIRNMKAASAKEIRDELKSRSEDDLRQVIQRLARFKKENKELLTYILFEADYEQGYVDRIKAYIDEKVLEVNTSNLYYGKKNIRKLLKEVKKFIRYSGNKETEVQLLIHFVYALRENVPKVFNSKVIRDLVARQITLIKVRISTLHEDLQFDYEQELNMIEL
ncbi:MULTISPECIES: hypothetical protein [Nonlabens]|nr:MULTISPECIES: hypothetical protein [Nonlabens]